MENALYTEIDRLRLQETTKAEVYANIRAKALAENECLRKAAAHAVSMMEKYPEASLPSPLLAALFDLKGKL